MLIKYIESALLLSTLLFMSGCSINSSKDISPLGISQNIDRYSDGLGDLNISLSSKEYYKNYFLPWHLQLPTKTLKEINWALSRYKNRECYGANLLPLKEDFFLSMKESINASKYATINKKAISLRELNIRALPTQEPLYMDPTKAGEGFPFDYLQNSTLHANKPLFVTHYSKNGEWVHVESSFTYGWVHSRDIAFVSDEEATKFENLPQAVVVQENIAIKDTKNSFYYKTKFGILFPIVLEDENSYRVLIADTYRGKELFKEVNISKKALHKGTLSFNKKNIKEVIVQLHGKKYGWGGLFGDRDCSSTLRDFYAPFGVWLPRNSSLQSRVGSVINIENLSIEDKIKKIKNDGVPFRTLLYKRGHIVLYTGVVNKKITVFQNMWGIKTKKSDIEGRYIIGRALFSTLEFGNDLEDYDNSGYIVKKLQSFNTLF